MTTWWRLYGLGNLNDSIMMSVESSIKLLKDRIDYLNGKKEWFSRNLGYVESEIEELNEKIRELTASV